jgi:hypothetical protein
MRDLFRRVAGHAQAFGNGGEFLRGLLGDLLARLGRFELVRIVEDVF